jgi:hypothetical protein
MTKAQGWLAIILLTAICALATFDSFWSRSYEYRIEFYPGIEAINRDVTNGWRISSARLARGGSDDSWGYEVILERRR